MKKWASRKLAVAILGVGAIAWGIQTGSPEAEAAVLSQGQLLLAGLGGVVSIVYVIVQGWIDKNKGGE